MIRRRLSSIVLALAVCDPAVAAAADRDPSLVGRTANLEFHSSFWLNLHHALYAAAWDRRPEGGGRARSAGTSVPLDGALTPSEQHAWDSAVGVYARDVASKDLLFDRGMTTTKIALGRAGADLSGTEIPATIREALTASAAVYKAHGWAVQDRANRAWIAETRGHVEQIAAEVTAKLASLFGTPWPDAPVRVDAVRVANRQGAYTSIGPPWIVVSTSDPDNQGWAASEIVFHESSHLLVRPVVQALADAGRETGASVPPVLWHVVLFYITGEVTRQALAAHGVTYTPYLDKTGLFDRAWPMYRTSIETTLPAFIAGKQPLAATADALLAALARESLIKRQIL